jgi:outer membrane protein assembly factor BamA
MIRTVLILVTSFLFSQFLAGMPGGQGNAIRRWDNTGFLQQGPQERDSLPGISLKFAGYPVLGYTPETRIAGGIYTHLLAGMPGTDRPSGLGLGAFFSQNRQFSLNLLPEVWWNRSHYHLSGELKWQYWPDRFYGIGNDARKEDREYYVSRIWGVKLDLLRSVYKNYYAGLLLEVEHNNIVEYDTVAHAVLPGGCIPGSDQSTISGLGIGMAWDSRSDILLPSSGAYCQFRLVFFENAFGSTYPHTKWILDLRKYWDLGHEQLFYLQVYGKFLWGKEIPFRNMALLGGDKFLRGYFRGRYRDHNLFLIQAEYHSPPLWRFSLVAFAGAGDVFHSAANLNEIRIKPSGGVGLRYRVFRDRRMNIRLDLAAGKGDRGIYLGMLEAF